MAFLGQRGTALIRKPWLEASHLLPDPIGINFLHNWVLDFSGLTCVASQRYCEGSPAREKKSLLFQPLCCLGWYWLLRWASGSSSFLDRHRMWRAPYGGESTLAFHRYSPGESHPFLLLTETSFSQAGAHQIPREKGSLTLLSTGAEGDSHPKGSFHPAAATSLSCEETSFLWHSHDGTSRLSCLWGLPKWHCRSPAARCWPCRGWNTTPSQV